MKARIRAGDLNRPLTVQTRTTTVDGEGNPIVTWVSAGTVWGKIQQQRSDEALEAGQLEQDTRHLVTLRWPTPVTHESRLLYGARVLDVRSVVNVDEANHRVDVLCLERAIAV